ncbi:hypothetical protein HEM79_022345, partial [Escherichia sp. 93.0816]|nr:hypothetical protein [Escherichia sp. 93.0816]
MVVGDNGWYKFLPLLTIPVIIENTLHCAKKKAVLLCLRWVQSRREYENVMQHMSSDFHLVDSWQINQQKVADFLSLGEEERDYNYGSSVPNASEIKILPSHYAKNLMDIRNSLPDTQEIKGNEMQKLNEVS